MNSGEGLAGDLELQRAILAGMAEGVHVSRVADGRIIYANATLCRMFGYEPGELDGELVSRLNPEGEPALEAIAAATAEGTGGPAVWRGELRSVRKDGSTFWTHANLSRLDHPSHGQVWIGVRSDVSDVRQALEILAAARDAAVAASKAKSDYLSRMSHELRTPLTAIIGFSDLLLMEERRERNRDSLEAILRAGEHLLSIINDILDIARIESGHLTLSVEPVRLATVVAESVALVAVAAESRGLRLTTCAGVAAGWVLADEHRLRQALLNLLSNAVKYNREGGEIVIDAGEATPGRVRLTIRDTGAGIAADRIPLLFQPFERLGAERTPIAGTGLGLALSRQLIDAMGGAVGADSVPGQGSTFWIELDGSDAAPAASSADDEIEIAGAPAAPANLRAVLYVEDNLATVGVMQQVFAQRPAIRLLTAMQGRLAVQLAHAHRPDLVIIDLHLPDVDGDEVLRQLKADPATCDIPVVILSADATARESERLLALGARSYLTKPVRIAAFLSLLDEILEPAKVSSLDS